MDAIEELVETSFRVVSDEELSALIIDHDMSILDKVDDKSLLEFANAILK